MANFDIVNLSHDLKKKKSHVGIFWDDQSDKRLFLEVPFGCSLEDLRKETEKAVRALSKELDGMSIND